MSQPGGGTDSGKGLGGGAIATISGFAVLLIVILQNNEDIQIKFLLWSFTTPLWLYTVIVAAFGALVWFGIGVIRRHRRRKERRND